MRVLLAPTLPESVSGVLLEQGVRLQLPQRDREQDAVRLARVLELERGGERPRTDHVLAPLALVVQLEEPLAVDRLARSRLVQTGERLRRVEDAGAQGVHQVECLARPPE